MIVCEARIAYDAVHVNMANTTPDILEVVAAAIVKAAAERGADIRKVLRHLLKMGDCDGKPDAA